MPDLMYWTYHSSAISHITQVRYQLLPAAHIGEGRSEILAQEVFGSSAARVDSRICGGSDIELGQFSSLGTSARTVAPNRCHS